MSETLKQQTKKGLYWSFFNQFSNYGMQFCVGIIMARLLTPSDYGITALPAVFMAIAAIFQDSGMAGALIRKPDLEEKDLSTVFIYSIIVGLTMYIILFTVSPYIAAFYETPVLTNLIRVTALTFLWGPLSTPQYVILKRKLDFKTPTKISIGTKIFSAIVGITMAYKGYGLWSLVISGVLSSFLGLILTVIAVKWYPKTGWSKKSFHYLWNYGNKMMASNLIDTAYSNITPLFVAKHYSTADLGVYNRARNYACMPSINLTAVIQNVTFPVLSKLQDNDQVLANNYRRMIKTTSFIVFPIMLMLAALARPLVLVMITAKWESCIILLQITCFSLMWHPIHSMNLNLLQVKGRTDLYFRLEIAKKILGLSILVITLPMGLIIFCIGDIIFSLLSTFINAYYTEKLIGIKFSTQMKDILPIFLNSIIMFGFILFFNSLFENMILQIILGGALGTCIYLGVAYFFKFQELKDAKFLLKKN